MRGFVVSVAAGDECVPFVPATFAVDAVEGAYFGIDRHEVDAERDAEPAAADGSVDDGGEKHGKFEDLKI